MKFKRGIILLFIFCFVMSFFSEVKAAVPKVLNVDPVKILVPVNATYIPPTTIKAFMADRNYKVLPVKWNVSKVTLKTPGVQKIYGTVAGYSKKVEYTIDVRNVLEVYGNSIKLKEGGYAYTLPEYLDIKYNNLDNSTWKVNWEKSVFNPEKAGIYTINGTLDSTGIKTQYTIEVVSQYVVRKDFEELKIDRGNEIDLKPVDFMMNPLISVTNMPVKYNASYDFEKHKKNLAEIARLCQLSFDTQYGNLDQLNYNFVRSFTSQYGNKYNGYYGIEFSEWRKPISFTNMGLNEYMHFYLEAFKYFLGEEAGENLFEFLDYAYVNNKVSPEKFNFNISPVGLIDRSDFAGPAAYSIYELTHKSGAKIHWIKYPMDDIDEFAVIFIKRGEEAQTLDWKLNDENAAGENKSLKRVDINTLMVKENGKALLNKTEFINKTGLSLINPPIVYNSNYTYSQHIGNLSKLLNMYGAGIDPSGYILVSSGEYNPDKATLNMGRIIQGKKENANGQYVGKIAIDRLFWRSSYDSSLSVNLQLNLLLETYKYYLGNQAGEDLWSLLDYAYVTGNLDGKRFNYTVKELSKSKSITPGRNLYTVYELTHKSGAVVQWLDSPQGYRDFDLVFIKRGK